MKKYLNKWVIFLPLCAAVILSSCEKEVSDNKIQSSPDEISHAVDKPFKMTSDTYPRINPIKAMELSNRPGMTAYANAGGGGVGNATHIGKIRNWFNQLVYSPTGADPATGTTLAPVADLLSYPVLGAPLPLIQANDFDEFRKANSWLKVPVSVNGCIVNSVIHNDKGDAIFTSLTTDAKLVFESPTRINFSAKGKFVGGRGKFAEATGTYVQTGFFNPQNFNDAAYNIEGTITY
ncbi:MAG TPA: hypothetical protein VLZ28_06770 [Daejeonella sp.]|nr:hypothetical protein [Daejeonella sp.]